LKLETMCISKHKISEYQFRDPSKSEIFGMFRRAKHGPYLRGIVFQSGTVILWDGGMATHYEIAREYGIDEYYYPIEMNSPNDVIYLINDLMLSSWNHNIEPEQVVEWMRTLPTFRGMSVDSRAWRN
jgi:hypothetical protein